MKMISQVMAAEDGGAPPPRPVGFGEMILPLGLMFAVFYFLLIRPNQKKMKTREQFLKSMKRGDDVITNGGLRGRVTGITDMYVTLEVADNVKLKVLKSHIGFSALDMKSESSKKNGN